ncbi:MULTISPECIES: hypothetical protein [Haloferax]|uniref:Uncharacterized protein n=1 Tax=Haloferax marinum TaxID=2666143 RepID=A0A6A8G5I1_9EURY|nr:MULTISPECIES: hypothetical protein [Haloferax]KAB1197455.1 hypothetical protein Hfx1150_07980 [Haloferax sp. CBA1150]MRW96500.1 hypothetical protein [Haloferax marinum]
MVSIIYDSGVVGESQSEIDEMSQRMLVYLLTEGPSTAKKMQEPVGAESEEQLLRRIDTQLGRSGANFVSRTTNGQMTLEGDVIEHYLLTDSGREFVYNHKSKLSLPVTLDELSKKVSEARVSLDEIFTQLESLEDRITKLESQ